MMRPFGSSSTSDKSQYAPLDKREKRQRPKHGVVEALGSVFSPARRLLQQQSRSQVDNAAPASPHVGKVDV